MYSQVVTGGNHFGIHDTYTLRTLSLSDQYLQDSGVYTNIWEASQNLLSQIRDDIYQCVGDLMKSINNNHRYIIFGMCYYRHQVLIIRDISWNEHQ